MGERKKDKFQNRTASTKQDSIQKKKDQESKYVLPCENLECTMMGELNVYQLQVFLILFKRMPADMMEDS